MTRFRDLHVIPPDQPCVVTWPSGKAEIALALSISPAGGTAPGFTYVALRTERVETPTTSPTESRAFMASTT